MYAVIRAGGKQYRVAPGDVIRLENQGNGTDGKIEFSDVLAVSGEPGQIVRPESSALVTGVALGASNSGRIERLEERVLGPRGPDKEFKTAAHMRFGTP